MCGETLLSTKIDQADGTSKSSSTKGLTPRRPAIVSSLGCSLPRADTAEIFEVTPVGQRLSPLP